MNALVKLGNGITSKDVAAMDLPMEATVNRSAMQMVPLASVPALLEMQAQLEAASATIDKEKAKLNAQILLGSFPTHNVTDPEIYVRAIVSVMMEFPASAVVHAVDTLTRERTFVPSRAEVLTACRMAARPLLLHRKRVEAMLAEHEARKLDREHKAEADAFSKRYLAEHGETPVAHLLRSFKTPATEESETENGK